MIISAPFPPVNIEPGGRGEVVVSSRENGFFRGDRRSEEPGGRGEVVVSSK